MKIESVYLHTMNIKELEENSRRQRLLLLYQCIEKMWNFASELSCSSDKDRIDKYMTSIVQQISSVTPEIILGSKSYNSKTRKVSLKLLDKFCRIFDKRECLIKYLNLICNSLNLIDEESLKNKSFLPPASIKCLSHIIKRWSGSPKTYSELLIAAKNQLTKMTSLLSTLIEIYSYSNDLNSSFMTTNTNMQNKANSNTELIKSIINFLKVFIAS